MRAHPTWSGGLVSFLQGVDHLPRPGRDLGRPDGLVPLLVASDPTGEPNPPAFRRDLDRHVGQGWRGPQLNPDPFDQFGVIDGYARPRMDKFTVRPGLRESLRLLPDDFTDA